jgi:thiosulfate/3-mercaptopyruvate sulfurtransferase
MKHSLHLLRAFLTIGLMLAVFGILPTATMADADGLDIIHPEELVKMLQLPRTGQPLILNIGPRMLYAQAHIPGSEYIGPGSSTEGIELLRKRVKSLPRNSPIVLYCGCCPWERCPNVRPAYKELKSMGFTRVKLLYIADNFGDDWVYKGYPVVKGQ